MKFICLGLLALALASAAIATRQKYDGYRLLNVFPTTEEHVKLLAKLEENPDFDIWNNAKGIKPQVDVLLSPSAYLTYTALFSLYNLKYYVADNNIQEKIDEQEQSDIMARRQARKDIVGIFASYAEINEYLEEVADSSKEISVHNLGKSYEGREMKYISFKRDDAEKKIWLDCGIHARERISPATCIYFIDYLRKGLESKNPDVIKILDKYEIQILPLVNPDGYEYARTSTPMWRKNRRVNAGSTCIGVDLNRNWGYYWMVGGASSNPCSDTYAGAFQDSEPETQNIQKHLLKNNEDYEIFMTVHTYGLWWFTPWGYSDTVLPADYNEMMTHINIAKTAIKNSLSGKGSNFVVGSSAQILYIAAGGSEDWAKGVAGIKHATCLELRPGQSGVDASYGFLLPADRIPNAGEETTAGIIAYIKSIGKL